MVINKIIYEVADKKFKKLLKEGCFQKVEYRRISFGYVYASVEYSLAWSKFLSMVDSKLKKNNINGIFVKNHSKLFQKKVEEIIEKISPEKIKNGR